MPATPGEFYADGLMLTKIEFGPRRHLIDAQDAHCMLRRRQVHDVDLMRFRQRHRRSCRALRLSPDSRQ